MKLISQSSINKRIKKKKNLKSVSLLPSRKRPGIKVGYNFFAQFNN